MNLSAPRLFQFDGNGRLDLQCLNPPNPGNQGDEGDPVIVSVLLPDSTEESLTVWIGDTVNKTFPIADPGRLVIDCPFKRSELPPSNGTYDVSFEYGSQRSPPVSVTLIDSMAPFVPKHVANVHGVYPPASDQNPCLIDVWIVPEFRLLMKNDPIIKPIANDVRSDVDLEIIWNSFVGESKEVGGITYKAAQDQWSVELALDCLTLQRSDFLLIQSTRAVEQFLSFTILL